MARRPKPGHKGARRAAHIVDDYCRVLWACAEWLSEARFVADHPLESLRLGRLPTHEIETIEADDQQRLLDACDPGSPLGQHDVVSRHLGALAPGLATERVDASPGGADGAARLVRANGGSQRRATRPLHRKRRPHGSRQLGRTPETIRRPSMDRC